MQKSRSRGFVDTGRHEGARIICPRYFSGAPDKDQICLIRHASMDYAARVLQPDDDTQPCKADETAARVQDEKQYFDGQAS